MVVDIFRDSFVISYINERGEEMFHTWDKEQYYYKINLRKDK